jgi:hypothetical protein
MNDIDHEARIAIVDAHTLAVAALMPFPVEVEADMGGTFALHIALGSRGNPDDPHDVAGVDPDPDNGPLAWWFDIDGGRESIPFEHTTDTDPTVVARWITEQARRAHSPAAERSFSTPTSPTAPAVDALPSTTTEPDTHEEKS